MNTKKILLISTGGTIAGNVSIEKGGDQKHNSAKDFDKKILHTKERIKKAWNIKLVVTAKELVGPNGKVVNVDSSNIVPEHWSSLSKMIKAEYDNYDGFIITHGTNTLGYTSAALSFSMINLNKPVIITGSQVPFGHPGSDALMNLDNSLRVSVWPYNNIKGVVVVFGSNIISGVHAKKSTEFNYDAFKSFSSNSLGDVGRIININEDALKVHNDFYNLKDLDYALTSSELIVKNNFDTNIASITEFPGMKPEIFTSLVENLGVKGIIIRAFGAGDPSTRFIEIFKELKEKEIPLIITTQAPNGNANCQVNEPGRLLKELNLAIPAYNMSMESQVAKLSWLIGNGKSYVEIISAFYKNFKGEIELMKERKQ